VEPKQETVEPIQEVVAYNLLFELVHIELQHIWAQLIAWVLIIIAVASM
jgi:hypothetical protein